MSAIGDRIRSVVFDDDSSPSAAISLDDVHFILSNEIRRWVIREIEEEEGGVDLSTLVDRRTEEIYGPSYGREEWLRQYSSLHQRHLPQLDKHDVIDYDDSNRVYRADAIGVVVDTMEAVQEVVG